MNVIVLFERSQIVMTEFIKKGHNAYSCDILPCYGEYPNRHILANLSELRDLGELSERSNLDDLDKLINLPNKWDLVIAHPPCTYLSSVSASRLFNKDHSIKDKEREMLGWKARKVFMNIFSINALRVCVENPAPMSYYGLPPYTQVIQPYQFGDSWSKRTCLWLRNLPKLVPTDIVKPNGSWVKEKYSSTYRSQTFEGIAKAMANQWNF